MQLSEVTANLPDGRPLLRGINLTAPAGRLTAICGRGGTGKSVLLDVIAGRFLGKVGGRIFFDHQPLEAEGMVGYRDQITRLNQQPQLLRMPVEAFVTFGCNGSVMRSASQALELAGMGESAPPERGSLCRR